MSMEYCPRCGKKVYVSDKFCASCGYHLIRTLGKEGFREPLLADFAKRSGLFRSTDEGVLGGVCAGIACKWAMNLVLVRFLVGIVAFLSVGTAVLAYLFLWLLLPGIPTSKSH